MKKHYSLRNGFTAYQDDEKSSEKSNFEDEFHRKVDSYQIFRGYFSEKVKSFSENKSIVPMLENPINENKGRNNLEVISSQKPLLSMTINEKLKFQNSEFEFQNKFIKSNYVVEFTSQFLERNEVLVSGQLSKWQNDCKLFSQNMLASRQEVILKFVCLLNEAELRAFFNRADSLKIKLDKLLEKCLQIQTNLVQINQHVNENSLVLYHRHFPVFLSILYFTKPSWILFPKKVISGSILDVVSYENLKEIFPSETSVKRISPTSKISDNFHGRGLIFDLENLKYASKKHISYSELNLLPAFCKTRINEVKNDEYQTEINSISSSDIDLITELQNCQQLLSHIENTYNLVKKRLESSLFIKFLALKNKWSDTLYESSEEVIHLELDYELTNNFAQDDILDIKKLDNIRSSYTDMLHSSNDETEFYYNPEVFLNTHANDDFKGNSILVRALPKIQFSKAIRNGKSITYKSIITKPGEKLAFRFLDPLSDIDDEILKIQAILSRLEEKYDIIENEVFSWLQNTENSAENDFISSDKDIDNDNLNNFCENNAKKDNCLMRFKAGNFYDWDLDDFEFTDTKLPIIMEEETSESELNDSESSLDGSYKSWQPDSRASTSSEDSDSLSSPEISYEWRNKCTKFKTDKFPGNLNSKLESNLSVTSETRYITSKRSINVNSDHFGFVSVLLHNLQRLCNSEDTISAKN